MCCISCCNARSSKGDMHDMMRTVGRQFPRHAFDREVPHAVMTTQHLVRTTAHEAPKVATRNLCRPPEGSTTCATEALVLRSSMWRLESSHSALMAATSSTKMMAAVLPKPPKGDTMLHHDRQACGMVAHSGTLLATNPAATGGMWP